MPPSTAKFHTYGRLPDPDLLPSRQSQFPMAEEVQLGSCGRLRTIRARIRLFGVPEGSIEHVFQSGFSTFGGCGCIMQDPSGKHTLTSQAWRPQLEFTGIDGPGEDVALRSGYMPPPSAEAILALLGPGDHIVVVWKVCRLLSLS